MAIDSIGTRIIPNRAKRSPAWGKIGRCILLVSIALASSEKNAAEMNRECVSLAAERDFRGAEECFGRVLKLRPKYAEALNNKGTTLYNQGEPEEAWRYFNRAVELKPDYLDARYNRCVALGKLGRSEEAGICFSTEEGAKTSKR